MKKRKTLLILFFGSLVGIAMVALLFVLSEDSIHRQKDVFIRRYLNHPLKKTEVIDLGYNSYYIAGISDDNIYLGNVSAPFHLLKINSSLTDTLHIKINLEDSKLQLRNPRVRVNPPEFYVIDGSVPCVFKGNTNDWKGSLIMKDAAYFSFAEPMDSSSIVIRSKSSASKENILGKITMRDSVKVIVSPDLLQKQIDGVFCTDGMLLFGKELQKLVYVYFYRNQFIVANSNLDQEYIGKTIDTISKAQINVASITSKKSNTLRSRPLIVNKQSSIYKNFLFVNSNMFGKYDEPERLKKTSIIDVYDLIKNTYEFSFYVNNHKDKKMSRFKVYENQFIAMADQYLITYALKPEEFKGMKITEVNN